MILKITKNTKNAGKESGENRKSVSSVITTTICKHWMYVETKHKRNSDGILFCLRYRKKKEIIMKLNKRMHSIKVK